MKLVEPEAPRERQALLYRHFEIEVNKETGKREVIAWCPNPETGEAEREDAPGWRPPPGTLMPSGPGQG